MANQKSSLPLAIAFCMIMPAMIYTKTTEQIAVNENGSLDKLDKITADSNILFAEDFEHTLDFITSRYDNIRNKEGMEISADIPPGSRGRQSLKITSIGGKNDGGHLFKSFRPGFDSTVYVRYYVKYPRIDSGYIHHESIWFGGYDPPLRYPSPKAGVCDVDGRLAIAYEPSLNGRQLDNYLYWPGMKSSPNGNRCFGNVLYDAQKRHFVDWDKWMCMEIMIKLNNPVSASNGELAIWKNGELVGHWGPGFPNGKWLHDHWGADQAAAKFEGFRWRNNASLNINYIWIEFFHDLAPPGQEGYILYDDIVIAKNYTGPHR